MMYRKVAAIMLAGTLLAACADGPGPKEGVGTILGAATGAVLGAQVGQGKGQLAAVAAGTLLGAFAGSEIGKSLDKADIAYAERTRQRTLESNPSGTTSTWTNPDSGHSGTITPVKTYQQADGNYCREYQTTVTVGGKTEEAYGTACRQPDGTWKIVD